MVTMAAERKRFMLENGSLLQEKLIATSNGKYFPFRIFSAKEIKIATNNYDPRCIFYEFGDKWYKGALDGRDVSIWIPNENRYIDPKTNISTSHHHEIFYGRIGGMVNNIAMAAQLSGHKNILKLLGCCLETRIPIPVYEYAGNRNFNAQFRGSKGTDHHPIKQLLWKSRLKIAREIAHAVAYLHTAFSRPIVYRDINPSNIFLDENNIPKLFNFSESMSIPEGETPKAGSRGGISGYLCPEYEITEKVDVYSFGALLIHLLLTHRFCDLQGPGHYDYGLGTWMIKFIGGYSLSDNLKYLLTCHSIDEVVDPMILSEGQGIVEHQQCLAVVELALKCRETIKEKRPTMVEVTKRLWQIERDLTLVADREKSILEERGVLLRKLIASWNDRCNVLHMFSAEELKKATNNYNPDKVFSWSKLGIWYKGSVEERSISICKISDFNWHEHVNNEFKIAFQLRAHKNVLKLLGCCLETPCPALVYESAENGTLYNQILPFRSQSQPLLWNDKLKIVKQIADGVAHLHTAFSTTIIHRDLSLLNIFLDEHYVAKISKFSDSVWIHDGETLMTHSIVGNERFMSSQYEPDSELSDKTDVYTFGVLLFELLQEWTFNELDLFIRREDDFCFWMRNVERDHLLPYLRQYWECHCIDDFLDPGILVDQQQRQQWQEVVELAFSCLETVKEKRPMMIEVARQLGQIERSLTAITEKERSEIENKKTFMKELIASYNGGRKCNIHLHSFSAEELRKATANYRPHKIIGWSNLGIWYTTSNGNLNMTLCKISGKHWRERIQNEFRMATKLRKHQNVLKLLGYCIETQIPTLVYERVHFHFRTELHDWLSFDKRLMIAKEIADEITQLHSAFSMPIIHRNIESANIFLDQSLVPKLSNFSQSMSIHEGIETLVTDQNEGTKRYMAPEYLKDGAVSVKIDIYSFGVLLIELLIGSKLFDLFDLADKGGGLLLDHLKEFVTCHGINEIVEPKFLKEGEGLHEQQQWGAMLEVALRCMETTKEQRPTMAEISKELKKI